MQFFDTTGQERFPTLEKIYYENADAAIIVFDVSDGNTFNSAIKFKTKIDHFGISMKKQIPTILLANKIDSIHENNWKKIQNEMDEFCKKSMFI
mgnify:CR=1 FL=1